MNTKICHICQDFADHETASCPNSVCKTCHQRGHVSKNCTQNSKNAKNVSFDEALLPFTPSKVGQVISDSKKKNFEKFQEFLTNYKKPENQNSPNFQPQSKVRKLDACPDLEWAKNEDFSGIPLNLPRKQTNPGRNNVVNVIVNNDLGLQEISNFIDQVSSATSGKSPTFVFNEKKNSNFATRIKVLSDFCL